MLQIQTYDRAAALRYAQRWALDRNPRYFDFSRFGGDCTSFISQCLHAGGAPMNERATLGWYYRNPRNRAPAWSGVRFLHEFLLHNEGIGPFAKEVSASRAEPGDVIQLGNENRYYHTLLVLRADGNTPLVAAHSDDAWQRPLASYAFERMRVLHILGIRREEKGESRNADD